MIHFICLSMVIIICQAISKGNYMDNDERQIVLDLHNWFRNRFTKNVYLKESISSDMTAMDWDEQLSIKAKKLSAHCKSSIKLSNDYKFGRVDIEKPSNFSDSNIALYKVIFNNWMNEFLKFGSTCQDNQTSCVNIRQILYSRADKVGCEATFCANKKKTVYVCLYNIKPGPKENLFEVGEPCSKCPEHKPFCLDRSLCASMHQCQKRNRNSDCKSFEISSIGAYCEILTPVCHIADTRKLCPKTCEKELTRMKKDVIELKREIIINDEKSGCVDANSKCQRWKDQSYCHIEEIQKQCMSSCQMCANKGDKISCYESTLKRITCLKVKNINMCAADDMQEICPLTCGNSKCQPDLEPGIGGLRSAAEPGQCKYMTKICHNEGVSIVCPKTCGKKTTVGSSKNSQSTTTELAICPLMKNICSDPTVSAMCKKTCGTSTTSSKKTTVGSSKHSQSTTTELAICPLMKNICSDPTVSAMCKKTCGTSTTLKSSTSGISISSTYFSTEPPICTDMKELCSKTSVSVMCKKTCASTTTAINSTTKCTESERRGAMCKILKNQGQCGQKEIKMACPITCGLCN